MVVLRALLVTALIANFFASAAWCLVHELICGIRFWKEIPLGPSSKLYWDDIVDASLFEC